MDRFSLETKVVTLQRLCIVLSTLVVVLLSVELFEFVASSRTVQASTTPDVMRVRQLIVVDDKGVERVIVAGSLPGQWQNGKVNTRRVTRPFKQGGILIFDKDGVERGGYLTEDRSDNALLTLDDKQQQEVLLVTGPQPTSSFRMWAGKDSLELRVDPDMGGPTFRMVRNGRSFFEQPPQPKPVH